MNTERLYRAEATALINSLARKLGPTLEPMGSYRRMAWMIGDLDMITPDPLVLEQAKKIGTIISAGPSKVIMRLAFWGMVVQVDFNLVLPCHRGPGLLHHTGNGKFNMICRWRAIQEGWKLNQYGLWKEGVRIDANTEEDILERLEMPHHLDPSTREK